MVVLKELFFDFPLWEGVGVFKELVLAVSVLEGCGGFERTDF